MSYLISSRSSICLILSPHLLVDGYSPYEELNGGCWAKFHRQANMSGVPIHRAHLRLSTHNRNEEFTGRQVKGSLTQDDLWRFQFSRKTPELKSMPEFGMSLSDFPPCRLAKGVWLFQLPYRVRSVSHED